MGLEIKQSIERNSEIVKKCVTNCVFMQHANNKTGFSQTTSFVCQFSVVWSVSKFIGQFPGCKSENLKTGTNRTRDPITTLPILYRLTVDHSMVYRKMVEV